jgi:hypothetical protein
VIEKQYYDILRSKNKQYDQMLKFLMFSLIFSLIALIINDPSFNQNNQAMAQSSEDAKEVSDFIAKGTIDSVLYTTSGKWAAKGQWDLIVSDGKISSFNSDMGWNNGTKGHTHEFRNFESSDDEIQFDKNGIMTIEGSMDVGTNHAVSWPKVSSTITIEQGKIISISVDDEDVDHHFGNQAVHGAVAMMKPCSSKPGPNMEVPIGCA